MLGGIFFVRFWVGNAFVASCSLFEQQIGFVPVGTYVSASRITHFLRQGEAVVAVEGSLSVQDTEFHAFHAQRGDAVRELALYSSDVDAEYRAALSAGAQSHTPPAQRDGVHYATVVIPFGDVLLSFYSVPSHLRACPTVLPWAGAPALTRGASPVESVPSETAALFTALDHATLVVERGQLGAALRFLHALGCESLPIEAETGADPAASDTAAGVLVDTGVTGAAATAAAAADATMLLTDGVGGGAGGGGAVAAAMRSAAVRAGSFAIVVAEPAPSVALSQVQEFLDNNGGPGIQHVALRTGDIVRAVQHLRQHGIGFVPVPDAYYALVAGDGAAVPYVAARWEHIRALDILVDTHAARAGPAPAPTAPFLLQTFTHPLVDRPTFFLEVIQRGGGATGFGQGNMMALFRAVELSQGAPPALVRAASS